LIHQLQYRCSVRPTKSLLDKAREAWVKGETVAGVRILPLSWSGCSTKNAVLRGAYVGNAGIVKQYHKAGTTLTDHDTRKAPSLALIWRIARLCGIKPLLVRMDRTRRGWHCVIVWNRRFNPMETIALQCALGSDLRRETYNLARVFSGKARNKRWNLLFSEKVK